MSGKICAGPLLFSSFFAENLQPRESREVKLVKGYVRLHSSFLRYEMITFGATSGAHPYLRIHRVIIFTVPLHVFDALITVFTLHFRSRTIKGLHCLGYM